MDKGWKIVGKGLTIDKPQDIDGQTYLGCKQERWEMDLPGGGKAQVDVKNMEDFMKSCVQLYLDLSPGVQLKTVATPFIVEDQHKAPARAPCADGPVEECPWCCHTFVPNPFPSVSALERHRKSLKANGPASGTGGFGDTGTISASGTGPGADMGEDRGRIAPVAAKILM